MTTAFVLGNGISRQCVDPATLKEFGTVYGCNALYRTFVPDVLVSTDPPVSAAIQRSGYSKKHKHYTRRPLIDLGASKIPKNYYAYSSGPIALALAAEDNHQYIYLLGFDLGASAVGTFNNMYADTEFYKKSSAVPTYTGNWVKQITAVVVKFSNTQFVRVVGPTTAQIEQFDQLPNLQKMPMELFVDRINNTKDF
jgi:hypothetical protein